METQASACPQQQQQHAEPEVQPQHLSRHRMRRLLMVWVVPLLATAVIVPSLTYWAVRILDKPKRAAEKQALDERDQAQKAEAAVKGQLDQALAARQTAAVQRDQARAAEKRAQRSVQVNKAVIAFLQSGLLSADHPKGWGSVASGKAVTLRQAVDRAEAKVATAFVDQPLVEAAVRQVLGTTYLAMGEAERASQQYERALSLWEIELGPDHPDTSECRNQLAVALRRANRHDEASSLYNQNRLSSSHAAALAIQGAALLANKKPAQAEFKLRESLALRQKIQPDAWTTFDAQSMLGAALLNQKKYAAAEPLLLAGYDGMKQRQAKIPSQDRSHLIKALENLVQLYQAWDKQDKATKWQEELASANHLPKKP